MPAKTPKHGSKKEVIKQPPLYMVWVKPETDDPRKTGGYKLQKRPLNKELTN